MADPTLIIDAEPDWGETPEVAYGFSTVIQGNPFFKEQRRPLLSSAVRTISCTFKVENENAQRILNRLISGVPQVCCTPVYSEPLFASVITQGASLLTIQTDMTYLWNAQNSSYLVLLDYTTGASEMLRVASVAGQAVTLSAPIVGVWTAAQTVIYPAFASILQDVKTVNATSRVVSFDVQFEEISIGAEATKVWVGFTDVVCPEDVVVITPPPIEVTGTDGPKDGFYYDAVSSVNTADQLLFGTYIGKTISMVIQFDGITWPKDMTITTAILRLECIWTPWEGSTLILKYKAIAADNANGMPYSWAAFQALTKTTAEVLGPSGGSVYDYHGGQSYDSPNLASILQEVINRAGWVSGNSLILVVSVSSSAAYSYVWSYPFDNAISAGHARPTLLVS
jgi:hypothetical protein